MHSAKSLLCVFLCLALLFALVACTPSAPDPTDPPTTTEAPTPAPTPEPTPEPTDPPVLYDFEDDALALAANMPEGWTIADLETLGEMNGITADPMTEEALQKQFDTLGALFVFYAVDSEGNNINIIKEKLTSADVSIEDYLDACYPQLLSQLEQVGATDIQAERCVVAFAGAQQQGIALQYQIGEVSIFQRCIFLIADDVIYNFTLTTTTTDTTDRLISCFFSEK